jgi:hypothetical protein
MTEHQDRRDGGTNSIEELRLQLLANGYSPIPNLDKRTFMKGWPDVVIDAEEIARWSRRHRRWTATGLRVEHGLAVVDIDISDPAAFAVVLKAMQERHPDVVECGLQRSGKGCKLAIFVRTAELFSRIHTRRWLAPGATADDDSHSVEIFGGASPRQFGAFGPHTVADDGTVVVSYQWDDLGDPSTVPLAELPVFPKQVFYDLADVAEDMLKRLGFTPVPNSTAGENDAARVYDLTDDMRFDLSDGRSVLLPELRQLAAEAEGLRCSASWREGDQAKRRDRCLVSLGRSGGVCVWESASGVTHCEKDREPHDYDLDIDRVAERLRELDEKTRNKLHARDGAVVAATKMLETYAFCPNQPANVVPLWASSLDEGMTLTNFRLLLTPHCDEEIGPLGGVRKISPADIWIGSDSRVAVAGLRMRPDQPRPTYEEAGKLWANVYSPPLHDVAGGDPAIGIEFIESLLPDAGERHWFLQWLGHKVRRPDIPGPAVIMVAKKQGTGRGTLGELLRRVFGAPYVKQLPYTMFTGKTYQSQYNDWGAEALVAVVNESSEAVDGSVYKAKHSAYEHLKELVEPRPSLRMFVCKGRPNFTALSFTSYIIATNHADALPIPATDRRFAVLTNGEPREEAFWRKLNAWMDDEANVAAFVAWLRSYDLTGYSPFVAPAVTEGKLHMSEAAVSDLDRGIEEALKNVSGEVFAAEQIIELTRQAGSVYGFDYPDRWQPVAKKLVQSTCHRVGEFKGKNWQPAIDGKRYAIYARDRETAARWTHADSALLRTEIEKSGPLSASNVVAAVFRR